MIPQKEERVLKLFKSSLASCQYHMKSGKTLHFKNGKYATDQEDEIAELEAEVKARHPHIFVDSGEASITELAYRDPLAGIKARAIEEYLASQGAQGKDMGTSETPKNTGMLTTAGLAALKARSDSKG